MTGPTRSLAPALRSFLAAARPEPDDDLLRRFVAARDEAAFRALMSRHGPMVLGVSRRVTRDAHAAEDVFQATFLLLARKADTIRRPEALGAWLHQAAFRLALRARHARDLCPASIPPRPLLATPPSPLDDLTARELLAVLDDELARLPEQHRLAVVLCCLEGLSVEEAAVRLGWARGAVKGRLERARARLRQRLDRRGLGLSTALAAPLLLGDTAGGLPEPLMAATEAVVRGSPPPAAVCALAEGGMPGLGLTRLKLVCAALVLAAALGTAAMLPRQRPPAPAGAVAAGPPAAHKGEPLPAGARLRLGEMDRRAVGARIAFSSDGRSIVGARDGRQVTVWDARTGKVRQSRELADTVPGWGELSPDGRWLVTFGADVKRVQPALVLWGPQTGRRGRDFPLPPTSHASPVVFSSDSKRLAAVVAAGDKRLHVWSVDTGEKLLEGEIDSGDWCQQVLFSPDGKYVLICASGSGHGLYCWEVASKRRLWKTRDVFTHHIAVTPEGKVICPVFPKRPTVLDVRTGRPSELPLPALLPGQRLVVTPDGRRLLDGGRDGVNVWDLETGRKIRTLPGSYAEMVLAPDGKSVVTHTGTLQRWDLSTGKALWAEEDRGHADAVSRLVLSADGSRLASASMDGTLRTWDTTTGKPVHVWRGYRPRRAWPMAGFCYGGVEALDMSPDGRWVAAVGQSEHRLRVWDASTGKERRALEPVEGRARDRLPTVYHLRVGADGRTATGLVDFYRPLPQEKTWPRGALVRWDLEAGKVAQVSELQQSPRSHSHFAADARWFVSAGRVCDARTSREISRLERVEESPDECESIFSPDGLLLFATWRAVDKGKPFPRQQPPSGWRVYVWEALTGKVVAQFTVPHLGAEWAWHPGGRMVACGDGGVVRLWDVRSGKVVKEWKMPQRLAVAPWNRLHSFTFSPDGRTLATGHPDGTILLWDVAVAAARPAPLLPREMESLWGELRSADAGKAWAAAWRLADCPKEAVALLGARLKPVRPAPAEVTRRLIAALDSDSRHQRDEATKKLEALAARAEPALRTALAGTPSAEQKRRISKLLAALAQPAALTVDQMRDLRAAAVLGWMATPEARKVLESLADGVPADRLTQQARTGLHRRR
jgi:RNA polymerase sigma factor (sigma-70 family)